MKSTTVITPVEIETPIEHIFTPHDIHENYGADALTAYIDENNIKILSQYTLADGVTTEMNSHQLGVIWGEMLDNILRMSDINLGQMMRNYQQAKNINQQQPIAEAIIKAVVPSMKHDEAHIEALILGICILLGDDADGLKVNSLVDYVETRAAVLITDTPGSTQKVA